MLCPREALVPRSWGKSLGFILQATKPLEGFPGETRGGSFCTEGPGVARGEAEVGETARRLLHSPGEPQNWRRARGMERSRRIQEVSGDRGARTCLLPERLCDCGQQQEKETRRGNWTRPEQLRDGGGTLRRRARVGRGRRARRGDTLRDTASLDIKGISFSLSFGDKEQRKGIG